MSERLKKNNGLIGAGSVLHDRRGRTIPIAVLLISVVLLSLSSGIYVGASFFAQQAPNVTVTTTIYTTTTSWTTSTIWSTMTTVVQGILATVEYTTSTSTIYVTASTSSSTTATTSTRKGTTVTITQVTGAVGSVTVKGYLKDVNGNGLQGLQVRITVDGGYTGRVTTASGGSFSYTGTGPTAKGTHYVTVWFDGNSQYTASSATRSYSF